MAEPVAELRKAPVDKIHRVLGQPEYALKQQEQNGKQNKISPTPVQEDVIQLFGEQGFLQRRWFRYRLFQNSANALIPLKYFFRLRFGMIEIIRLFNRFYFILQVFVQGKRFVIDKVMNGFVIT